MERFGGTGWLLTGAALAVAVPLSGIHRWLLATVGKVVTLPWIDLLVGAILLSVCVALYFRSHWIATARTLRELADRTRDGGERVSRLADEIDNSAYLIRDNLEEILPRIETTGERDELFLGGAISHARRLGSLAHRARGIGARLRGREPEPGSEHPREENSQ